MAPYRRVHDSHLLQADCQEPGSVPEPYARQSEYGLFFLVWFQGPKEVKEDNRITFEQLDDEIVLVCRSAERPDEGNYNVTLRNNKGSDTANIRVIILDKPGAPEGPLDVSKITPESCTLKWNPPKVGFLSHSSLHTHTRTPV